MIYTYMYSHFIDCPNFFRKKKSTKSTTSLLIEPKKKMQVRVLD